GSATPGPILPAMESDRFPRFLEDPRVTALGSRTPAGPKVSGRCDTSTRPPHGSTAWAPATARDFGAQLPSSGHSLSTLRPGHRWTGRKTRFRLLAKLYRAGLITCRVPTKGFKDYPLHLIPLPQAFPGAMTPFCSPKVGNSTTKETIRK